MWTGALEADVPGFLRGTRPGENAIDTKQLASNPRSKLTVRHCLFQGWKQPGQIGNLAALNIKNHVEARIENCVFRDNEICLRLRGGEGEYGGALVAVERCAVYDSEIAVRIENGIRDLTIRNLGIGSGVRTRYAMAGGGVSTGYKNEGEHQPPPFEEVIKTGLLKP
jgi:hypothetical protein